MQPYGPTRPDRRRYPLLLSYALLNATPAAAAARVRAEYSTVVSEWFSVGFVQPQTINSALVCLPVFLSAI